jgi:hypothetical protein
MANQVEALRQATACLDEYEQELRKRIERLKDFKALQQIVVELLQRFPEPMAGDEFYNSPEVRTSFNLDAGTHQALMVNRDCKSIQEVIEPLRFLRKRLGKYEVTDDPDFKRRIYKFNVDGCALVFQAFFWASEDQLCKYVQIGVKEEPVFKLRCAGQEVTDEVS